MNSMILLTALTVGQPATGAPPMPIPIVAVPVAGAQPTQLPPMVMPPAGMPQGMTPPGMAPMTGMPMSNGNGKGNGNGDEKKDEDKKDEDKKNEEKKDDPPEPYALMRILSTTRFGGWLNDKGITIDGWAEGNYTLSSAHKNNLPVTFNDRADFWQFNQNYLRIYKTVDTSKDERQFGFRVDTILPGTDARFSIARGFLNGQLKPANADGSLPNYYPIDVYQLYVDTFLPNLGPKGTTVRVGRFASHCGYELVQGAETPFMQRPYLFQYNPFTHTGLWAISPLNDTWTVSNGLVMGSDNSFAAVARPTYIGQLKWAPKEGKTSALINVVATDPRYDASAGFPFYNVYEFQMTHNFNKKLTYVFDTVFSHIDGAPLPGGATGSATWYGAAQYLFYKHTDKLTSNFRVELFEDTKGFRTGFQGLYTEVTYGLAWSPVRSVIFRPTVRYDHNNNSRPFEGKPDLFTCAFDLILRY